MYAPSFFVAGPKGSMTFATVTPFFRPATMLLFRSTAGLTTYSSFNYETSRLLEEGAVGSALMNVLGTILGAFAAGWLGMLSARLLLGR
jgi:CrcB protein